MFITPSFKKSLIVEQFQGNYLKRFLGSSSRVVASHADFLRLVTPDVFRLVTRDKPKNVCVGGYKRVAGFNRTLEQYWPKLTNQKTHSMVMF